MRARNLPSQTTDHVCRREVELVAGLFQQQLAEGLLDSEAGSLGGVMTVNMSIDLLNTISHSRNTQMMRDPT